MGYKIVLWETSRKALLRVFKSINFTKGKSSIAAAIWGHYNVITWFSFDVTSPQNPVINSRCHFFDSRNGYSLVTYLTNMTKLSKKWWSRDLLVKIINYRNHLWETWVTKMQIRGFQLLGPRSPTRSLWKLHALLFYQSPFPPLPKL